MTVYAFGSAKGSPGVTTTVLALAVTWPGDDPILVADVDPAGGDLAPWLELPVQPGLVSLAAAGRRGLDAHALSQHLQALPGSDRVKLLCSPVAPQPVQAALASVRSSLIEVLADWPGIVLIDCGRLDIVSPATELFVTADEQILLCRPRVSAAHHLQERVRSLGTAQPVLLAVGEEPYSAEDLAATCGVNALGSVAFDARAADTLGDGPAIGTRALERSALIRTARTLADQLAERHEPVVDGPADPAAATSSPPSSPAAEGRPWSDQPPPPSAQPPPVGAPVPLPPPSAAPPAPADTSLPPPPADPGQLLPNEGHDDGQQAHQVEAPR